jgi:hypothetical protein
VDDLLGLHGGGSELAKHRIGSDQFFLDFLVRREAAGALPEIDLRLPAQVEPVEHLLGDLLLAAIDVVGDRPRPGVAPGDRLRLRARPHRERRHADLAGEKTTPLVVYSCDPFEHVTASLGPVEI